MYTDGSDGYTQLSAAARESYGRGDYATACELLTRALKHATEATAWRQTLDLLALVQFSAGDYPACLRSTEQLLQRCPDDLAVRLNLGVVLLRLNETARARQVMEQVLSAGAVSANLYDGFAQVCARMGEPDLARGYGQKALQIKDAQAREHFDPARFRLTGRAAPAFDHARPERNVIAFSLWGDDPRYLETAQLNVELCPHIYPGWACRFYVDRSVPPSFFERLRSILKRQRRRGQETPVQIVTMPGRRAHRTDGMLWRFHVSDDPDVDRFLVRDADSVINIKERIAVDDWIGSGKRFHIMRDAGAHTELIHGGLWGGVACVLPKIDDLLQAFRSDSHIGLDQKFLRAMVWPLVHQDARIHDRLYHGVLGGVPFSPLGLLPPGRHVGQDAWAVGPVRHKGG